MDNIMNSDTCRLCLCNNDTVLYPVDTRITWTNQDYPLAFRIIVCVGTDILPYDGLPQKVCHRCLYMTDAFFDFKESCEAAEKFLIAGLDSAADRIQKQKHILSLYSANDDKTSEIVNEMKQAPDDDNLHESIVMYDSAVEEKLLKSPPPSDTDTEETTSLAKENYETNSDREIGAITSDKNGRGVGNKLINENKQSSPNKRTTLALNIDESSSKLLTEKSKNSGTNNEVENIISVIDKDISVLPIEKTDERNLSELTEKSKNSRTNNEVEITIPVVDKDISILSIVRTDERNSSEMSTGNNEKSTTDNELEATVSDIDKDISVERIEQSNLNNGVTSSKVNRKERRRDTKKSTPDNQLEATVSGIDIDSAVLPIERTEQSNSGDGIASSKGNRKERRRDTEKSIADNQLKATVLVIDIESAVLPIERTEQSNLSGIASSKGNRKERRRNTKKSTADNQLEGIVSVIDIDGDILTIERTEQSNSSDGIVSSKENREKRRKNTKKSTVDYELEATVSVIDINSAVLPVEKADGRNSPEILTEKSNRSTTNKKCKTQVSVIDTDVSLLPIERTEQSNPSDEVVSYKEKRRKGIKRLNSKEITPVRSNDEQIPVKRSKRTRLKKGGRNNLKQSQDGQTGIVLEEDNSIDAETMKSLFSSSQSRQPIDIEDIIRKQREQYKFKENAEKRALQEKVASRQCTICDQILNSNEYRSHVESHKMAQEEDRKYTCIECNKSFGVKFSLTRHMLIHNPVKPFQCSKCKRSFSDRSNLLKHERSHNTDKPFGCPFCPMVYADNVDLLQHFRKSHTSEPEVPDVKNAAVVPLIDHECYTKRAKSKQESKSEILKNDSAEYEDSDEDDDLDYFETFGSDNENEISELGDIEVQGIDSDIDVIDMPIVDIDFWCSTCLTCFPTLSELEAHNEHHKKVKITCNICDKEFDTTNNLKDHYKLHFLLRTRKED